MPGILVLVTVAAGNNPAPSRDQAMVGRSVTSMSSLDIVSQLIVNFAPLASPDVSTGSVVIAVIASGKMKVNTSIRMIHILRISIVYVVVETTECVKAQV